jgi:hypothetical protein
LRAIVLGTLKKGRWEYGGKGATNWAEIFSSSSSCGGPSPKVPKATKGKKKEEDDEGEVGEEEKQEGGGRRESTRNPKTKMNKGGMRNLKRRLGGLGGGGRMDATMGCGGGFWGKIEGMK